MTLLAIDPGRDTGWALLSDDGALRACGLGAQFVHAQRALIERPQIYRGRQSKADPNDLITLAIQVGRYTERLEAVGTSVEHVIPHDWKGSLDPDVCCRRVVASLSDTERAILFAALAPLARVSLEGDGVFAGRRHNVIDAVGLAKWSLKRSRAGTF